VNMTSTKISSRFLVDWWTNCELGICTIHRRLGNFRMQSGTRAGGEAMLLRRGSGRMLSESAATVVVMVFNRALEGSAVVSLPVF
jgi:hypothetical protein